MAGLHVLSHPGPLCSSKLSGAENRAVKSSLVCFFVEFFCNS